MSTELEEQRFLAETREHVSEVQQALYDLATHLLHYTPRSAQTDLLVCLWGTAQAHDRSKFEEPERSAFTRVTPRLKEQTYGSEEYKASLAELGGALKHHYAENPHHPEYWDGGIREMPFLCLVEMVADWSAATLRMKDGDIEKSIEHNTVRFGIPERMLPLLRYLASATPAGWKISLSDREGVMAQEDLMYFCESRERMYLTWSRAEDALSRAEGA